MILADKIINERKKNGWSQEELAEKLSVSRQSVSKWESAQSTPDLQKIIQMSQIFGVTTDYLLKDDIEDVSLEVLDQEYAAEPVRSISLAEANEYIEDTKATAPVIALATALCICCPIVLLFLCGLLEANVFANEALCVGIGLFYLFGSISVAVAMFIKTGGKMNKYEFMKTENFETQYGVSGMAKELLKDSEPGYQASIIAGVVLCICCAIPLIISALMEAPDYVYIFMTCVLLVLVSIGVSCFIIGCSTHDCYKILIQEGEFNKKNKKINKKVNIIGSVYWPIITAIYLGISFYFMNWEISWIIWPVAGVIYGAISAITKAACELKEE